MESLIRDINLAPEGRKKIEWVANFMPALNSLREEFKGSHKFEGKTVVVSVHLEAKTAYLSTVLKEAGADVIVTGSNPLSTQDDVAAALVDMGITVYAWHDCSEEEYFMFLNKALDHKPHIIIDDGGDLVNLLHTTRKDAKERLIGGSEETTTGVHRLHALANAKQLSFPMIAVNDSYCKYLFDNRYGTGQSVWDGIMRTTNLTVTGKNVVVAGYGWCGKGVAMRAKGLGAHVIVTEVDPIKAIEAVFDGFKVMPMIEAAPIGDIFITVTGCKDVIRKEHYEVMKDQAIMCNAGHFDCEVNGVELAEVAVSHSNVRKNIEGYTLADGRTLYLLAGGRLVNLAAGDGHPAEIMDLSFAMQALAAEYLLDHGTTMEPAVHVLPHELDERIAKVKLNSMGYDLDTLTQEQYDYLHTVN
ncbi:adenosylhomocysteinase [uncultured Veillonella sp.]|uniref:adenosylhomocysteinase n=1 Tax=uncultured Veillonella sp. TaxID=159268 RepID=UPI0025D19C9C|nr:adenosylhomocysteinase [uncultured Veillonella sp.]MDY3974814.1 adenosylhomocysteinase [Veillonella caviae]